MHDAVGVHGPHCRYDLVEDETGLFLGKVVAVEDEVEQLFALAILSHDVLVLCFLEHLVNLEDARVVLRYCRLTRVLSSETSLRIMVLARGNLRVLIFLTARRLFVCSWTASKTSP